MYLLGLGRLLYVLSILCTACAFAVARVLSRRVVPCVREGWANALLALRGVQGVGHEISRCFTEQYPNFSVLTTLHGSCKSMTVRIASKTFSCICLTSTVT